MSNFAYAHVFERETRRARWRQKTVKGHARTRPWHEVPVTAGGLPPTTQNRISHYGWGLLALVLIAHLALVWYANHHIAEPARAVRKELSLEFVQPPKPPEPKIEPPKPTPPKPQAQKPAQVLPPIEQPVAAPMEEPGESSEPVVAVAPIAEAPPAPPREEPVTAAFGKAGYLNNPPPDYPPMAARQGWEGTVTLRVRVLANGTVETVEVQKSSGRKVLDDEAVRVVKRWSFVPSKRGDTPIDGWASVPIEFKLEQ